jgi:hypothetical protein
MIVAVDDMSVVPLRKMLRDVGLRDIHVVPLRVADTEREQLIEDLSLVADWRVWYGRGLDEESSDELEELLKRAIAALMPYLTPPYLPNRPGNQAGFTFDFTRCLTRIRLPCYLVLTLNQACGLRIPDWEWQRVARGIRFEAGNDDK